MPRKPASPLPRLLKENKNSYSRGRSTNIRNSQFDLKTEPRDYLQEGQQFNENGAGYHVGMERFMWPLAPAALHITSEPSGSTWSFVQNPFLHSAQADALPPKRPETEKPLFAHL